LPILTAFTSAAMREAKYRILEDGTFFGEIPSCPGVWSNKKSLEECREELQEALEGWLILKLRDRDQLPQIGGVDLNAAVAEI